MGSERIQFVDGISDTATVRLSLTTAPWSVLFNGTDVSPPTITRSVVNTLLTDGSQIPASAYDNRVIKLHLQLDPQPMSSSVAATQAQLLNRELDRTTNILRWQPDPNLPAMYFRTFRSSDYVPTLDVGINLYDFDISLIAEPFAYGVQESIGTVTINNDPEAGSNPKYVDITGVKGDVETPLQISITGANATTRQSVFAMRRSANPGTSVGFVQAESFAGGTDTTATATPGTLNSQMSGAGTIKMMFVDMTVGFTNNLTVTRMSTSLVPVAFSSSEVRGVYRVFVRSCASFGSATTAYQMQLEHGIRGIKNAVTNTRYPNVSGSPVPQMTDLGLVQFPEGFDPVSNGPSGVPYPVAGIPMKLHVSRDVAALNGGLGIDYFLFMPADDTFSIVSWGTSTPTAFVFDGFSRAVYGLQSGAVVDIANASFVGEPPKVSPGTTNRMFYINDVTPSPSAVDVVSGSAALTLSYWPRYLVVRPVST